MPIHLPTILEPFPPEADEKQWRLYFKVQSAGIDYVQAYKDTIGFFSVFSPKKSKALESARERYLKARDDYFDYTPSTVRKRR